MKKLKLMLPILDNTEIRYVKKVLLSNHVTEGDFTAAFEKKIARYLHVKHAIATTSATTALELVLRVLKIKTGDQVILPSFTHPATANSIVSVGAKPVFVDIDLNSFNLTAEYVCNLINKKTKAVIAVSQFGNPLDIKPILDLRKQYRFSLIEDAACSLGAKIGNQLVGSQADVTCFSFHPRKIITTGEGGMIVTNDQTVTRNVRIMKNFGLIRSKNKLVQKYWGSNLKFTDIQAALGISQMSKIESIIKNRIRQAEYYSSLLAPNEHIIIPQKRPNTRHTYQTYCLIIRKSNLRNKLANYLAKAGIETRIGSFALHLQPFFTSKREIKLPNSEKAYLDGLAIPLHHGLTTADQQFIVAKINEFFQNKNY